MRERSGEAPGEETDRRRLDIALAARDLSGKAQPRHGVEPQRRVEQFRRIEERVAVKAAEPGEFGLVEARNRPEDSYLFGMFQLGLEADHVEQAAELVVLAQLHDRVGFDPGLVRITSVCAPCFSLVWKPTMLNRVPSALSWRS